MDAEKSVLCPLFLDKYHFCISVYAIFCIILLKTPCSILQRQRTAGPEEIHLHQ